MSRSVDIPQRAEDKFQIFEKWLLENGADFSKLELRTYDDNVNGADSINAAARDNQMNMNSSTSDSEEKKETKDILKADARNSNAKHDGSAKHANCHHAARSMDGEEEESEMRGVHAKTFIPSETICVLVPQKCLITVEMGQATEIGQIILHSDLDLDAPKHIFLMIYILWDRKVNGDKSFFKPYYDILPKTLRNIPIFWEEEELEWLKGSYLLTQISDRIDAITEDYEAICQVAPQIKDIATLEEFKWARMCVCSRNFGLQIDGHRTSAMVPHADMLNHHRPRETKWSFDDDLKAFTITTLQPISAGAQVYDSYGQKCNHRFLLNYGFAVEDNRELDGFCPNEVPIELSIPEDDPLYKERYEFWMRGEAEGNISSGGFGNSSHALSAVMAAAAAASAGQGHNSNIARAFEVVAGAVNDIHPNLNRIDRSGAAGGEDSAPLVRRVRACVSNNENTRILFSMLRVLAANEEDLKAMSTAPTLPFGDSGCSLYLSRALRGYTAANPDNAAFATMQHAAFFRTCRDIRNPINLRNERAAMELLLRVLSKALDAYPCSLAKDVTDLMNEEAYPKFSNRRHAKIQVRGEKEILHHFAFWAQTAIDLIELIEREIAYERRKANGSADESTRPQPGFEFIIQAMEDDDALHFTILRYCCDVLGALRRDAMRNDTTTQSQHSMVNS